MKKYRQRIHDTRANKDLMWDRRQRGESVHSIAHLFHRARQSAINILAGFAGICALSGAYLRVRVRIQSRFPDGQAKK